MKGIILAGGTGSRLYPITKAVSKHLLPIYDKPMIYYPLSSLMLAGITEILIITRSEDLEIYQNLLGDGSSYGVNLSYLTQDEPKGIAEAFLIGEKFIGKDTVCLILGDNIFYGNSLSKFFEEASKIENGAKIFGYPVKNPEEFGVVEFDQNLDVISLEEKPNQPKSPYAVPGIYFYDNSVIEKAKLLKPSARGELEITGINNLYLEENNIKVQPFGRGIAWFDTGTHNGLLEASNFVEAVQNRQGFIISCLEEIAYRKKLISKEELRKCGMKLQSTNYGQYILNITDENRKYFSSK